MKYKEMREACDPEWRRTAEGQRDGRRRRLTSKPELRVCSDFVRVGSANAVRELSVVVRMSS
jgi:hypothetical protein